MRLHTMSVIMSWLVFIHAPYSPYALPEISPVDRKFTGLSQH